MTTTQSKGSAIKGILGVKLGMTQVFDENSQAIPVTVVQAGPCVVTQIRTLEKDGYEAVQLAFGAIDPRKVSKPESGQFVSEVLAMAMVLRESTAPQDRSVTAPHLDAYLKESA